MSIDKFEVRISMQRLLLGLILVIVPLSVIGLYITERSDKALEQSIGANFRTTASLYAAQVSDFIRDRVTVVNSMAADPSIVAAVRNASGNAHPVDIDKLKQTWNTAQGEAAVKNVMYSPGADSLRRQRELDSRLLRVFATDERGIVVAATQKPAKASYAEDTAWQAAYAQGQGAASIGNILFDDMRKVYYVEFASPIFDSGSSRLIGVMIAAMNVSDLLRSFQQNQIGNGSRALLVSDDGSILSGPNVDVFARLRSDEFGAIRDSLGSLQGRQTGYVVADLRAGRRIIGFAETGLKQRYDNLGWVVLISQDEHLATAPIRSVEQFALVMVGLGMLMVILVAVFYSIHRSAERTDIEDVLPGHARHPSSVTAG